MFNWISDQVYLAVESALKDALTPLAPFFRRVAIGGGILIVSAHSFGLAIIGLTIALFSAFAHLPYVAAGLWTALCLFGLSIILFLIGLYFTRKPN